MSDYKSSLPIRTEADLDEKVQIKIHDFIDPDGVDKQVEVSEKLLHSRVFGEDSDGVKRQLKLSQTGRIVTDGDYDASLNKKPSSNANIAHDRASTGAEPTEASQNKRPTAVVYDDGVKTVVSQDIALHDEDGVPYSTSNPLPVTVTDSEGDEIHAHDTSSSVAKDASATQTYTVSGGDLKLKQVHCSSSGRARFEIKVGPAGSEVTKRVLYASSSNNNPVFDLRSPITVPSGDNVLVVKTNTDTQPQDLHSLVVGDLV